MEECYTVNVRSRCLNSELDSAGACPESYRPRQNGVLTYYWVVSGRAASLKIRSNTLPVVGEPSDPCTVLTSRASILADKEKRRGAFRMSWSYTLLTSEAEDFN